MSRLCPVVSVALCFLGIPLVAAQEAQPSPSPTPPPPPAWSGAAQVSFLKTGGNTETSVLGLAVEAKHKGTSPLGVVAKGVVNRGSLAGEENLRNLLFSLRVARSFGDRTDLFVEAAYAEDIYAGIDSRFGGEVGVSQRLSVSGPHLLSVEAAAGLVHEVRLPGKTARDFGAARGGLTYKYVVSKTADFQNQANFVLNLKTSDDWRVTNTAALTAALNSRFSVKLSHAVSHLNTPPLGKKKTDTTVSAALVAKF